jgi:hypothetical protein
MSLPIQKKSSKLLEAPSSKQTLDVVVLYTSVELTEAALERAEQLAQGMELRVRLVCTQIVPYPLPVERPPINLTHLERKLAQISERCHLTVETEIVLARDMVTALKSTLKPESIIVLASNHRLWRTKEETLRNQCIKAGHEVVLCYAG